MSTKSAIQVCIKVRPCEPELPTLWQVKDKRAIQPLDSQADPCVFDYVYDQGSNNQEVFDGMAKHIVEACVRGFNGTIFAYGQTSSGKTYTMMGDQQNPGVMVLAAKEIFNQITNHSDRDFLLRVGYIEIYNEKIYDLLNKKNQDLKIFESNGMVNVNCEECIITSEDDLLQFLCLGNKERTVGETNMNERSSRSHAIFRIIIESRKADRSDDDAVIQSILNLVDLAGSERADQTGARGARLKEGSHINKSLHFLSNVIKSLAENEDNKYVSYRDSKLTRILQASLGGNAFTSIICTIRPSIMEESQSTLNFAMRAKKIHLKPQLNEIVSDATMMKRLEREIKLLKDRLAEEQAKNESQIKVRLLEQRIKTDTLKIITSNTITDRNKNRRRTWCPASSNLEETSTGSQEIPVAIGSNKPHASIKHSNLPKPSFYPTTNRPTQRALAGSKTINIMKSLEVEGETMSVEPNFEQATHQLTADHSRMRTITLTPTLAQMGAKGRELLERKLVELEAFTKIEQQINTEWDELNEKLSTATARVDELQTERQNLLQRSEDLQAQVDDLRKSKEEADKKIASYEEQLKTLKATAERLDMENRAAVELEFEFTSHKSKSKLRENELLTALSEKDSTIENLQKSLNDLSSEVLRNSKDDHMRSICPALETSCELICRKCVDLERLLEEYNNKPNDKNGAVAIDCECEQLRADIANTRAQLEGVQNAYKQITSDVAEKTELCDRLSRNVISAEEAKFTLQGKCDDLEQAQLRHEELIKIMQDEYDKIQQKYNALQHDYEILERTASSTEEEHKMLQTENESLQREISTLKQCVEEMQLKLLETTVSDVHEALVQQLKTSNEELMANLANMETKYCDLQGEYDDLSNQLVDSVQDGDSLREQFTALQETLKKTPLETDRLHAHIEQLEKEVNEKNQLLEATESTINEMREQMTNLQSELLEKSVIVNKVEDYQRQIESLEKQHAEMTMVCEELQEKVKETTINDSLSKSTTTMIAPDIDFEQEQEIGILKERLAQLNGELKQLQTEIKKQLIVVQQKDELIETMQLEMQELNERCLSMDVQIVELRSNVQQQQQLLDLQATKLAADANRIDQLQESNAKLTERSIKAEETLEERLNLAADIDSSKAEYEKHLQHLQLTLDTARVEFAKQEKINKDELDNANLEFLQKIEVSESRYRENLHKYNTEWEDRLQKLNSEGEAKLLAVNAEIAAEREQFIQEKHELESLYDESKKTIVELQDKLSFMVEDNEKVKAYADFEILSNEKLTNLHEKYERQLKDFEQLKLNLDSLELEKNALQAVVDDNKQIIQRLSQELESEQNVRQIETSKLNRELENAIEANSKAKSEYSEQLETYTEKISDLQEELRQANLMASDIEKLNLERQQIQEVLAKTKEHNMFLEKKADELESALLLAQNEVTTHRTQLESLQSKLDYTQEAKNNFSSAEAAYTQKLHELEKEMSEQAHQYNRKIEELISSEAELNFKMEALLKRKLELEASNDKLAASQELLNQEREHNANLQQSNDQLKSQLKAKQTEWNTLQQKLQQQETQLNIKQTEFNILQKSADVTNSQLLTLKQTLHQAESQLELKQTDCDTLQQSLQEATSLLDSKQTEFDAVQLTIKQMSEDNKEAHDSLEQAESQLKTKQAECNALKESLQQAACELETKQAAFDALQMSFKDLQCKLETKQAADCSLQQVESELKAKQAECSSLQQSLQQATSLLDSKQAEFDAVQLTIKQMSEDNKEAHDSLEQAESQLKTKQAECNALKESLQQATCELETKQAAFDALQMSFKDLQCKLEAKHAADCSLQQVESELKAKQAECSSLQQSLQQAASQLQNKQDALDALQLTLNQTQLQLDSKQEAHTAVQTAESQIKAKQAECNSLHNFLQESRSNLHQVESQLKAKQAECNSLQQSLQKAVSQLDSKQAALDASLRQSDLQLKAKQTDCDSLQQTVQELKAQLAASEEMVLRAKELQIEFDKLKSNQNSLQAERERLDATISSLLEDKRNLEEKLCSTNEIVQKLEMDLKSKSNCSNISFDSTTSNTSPAPRKSLDRDHHIPRKSLISESEVRRNRRISTHDERRQSYWNDSRHVACMTDPVDTNCNCTELDRKLKECQFELFVRESKVTALSIELKNHPLKEENAQLKKRLQEEQQKSRDEIKRMKSKNSDLMSKVNAFSASAAISSSGNCAAIPLQKLTSVETQTESDLVVELKKTTEKLNDCIQVCRHRYNHIKDLEERLKQNENSDTSNISSQTIGQINLLKSKLEIQKKEIATLTNKYEYAKKALKLRKDEIEELRKGAGTAVTAACSK
ncbi:kinesin-like protein KIF15 isoform X1 [Drosophila albomicans]|uniref:Kinesin-like protein KIF15 isoform X1 n=2 Tax=Drosophila albomicans TaxID=7291 RepID=A0A6P8W351_DROAB|nr:kinesin-like protein KIF15 isoform X1 [Drosophila albomicans]